MSNLDLNHLMSMAHSPVKNYVVPGLTSYLIGQPSKNGCVRLFHSTRRHQEVITPHSHRFNFQCLVLNGKVINRIWNKLSDFDSSSQKFIGNGDLYAATTIKCDGMGKYNEVGTEYDYWNFTDYVFSSGETYSMMADEVHSIFFDRDTYVLFLEGKPESDTSIVLESVVDGETIKTFKVEPWMFKRTFHE